MLKIKNKNNKGFTLVDVLIGTFLVLIVFVGIFGVLQLGLKVTGQSKNRVTATAIANAEMEKIRNLPYASVGIQGGFPSGSLLAQENITRNSVEYSIEKRVDYVVDASDGIAYPDDECPNDYKVAEVKISWTGRFGGEVKVHTYFTPKNLAQECSNSGGILHVSVFDSRGTMISAPLIEVKNPDTKENIKVATPDSGEHYFSLAAGTYKVVVAKDGYNTAMSYGTLEVTTPEKPNPIILEGQLTEISLPIDKVSSFSIDTFSPWGEDSFSDSFTDSSKIFGSSNIAIDLGKVSLSQVENQYQTPGYVISVPIIPSSLTNWEELSFVDDEPTDTQIIYKILYLEEENWILIPDNALPNNSIGFTSSPVNLTGLNTTTYSQIKIQGFLSTNDTDFAPSIYSWQTSWRTNLPTPIPNVNFKLEEEKIIGHDDQEDEVSEYSENFVSDSGGHKNISNLTADNYNFSVPSSTGLDLVNIDPAPQPVNLASDTNVSVKLYLDSENSLLVTVKDIETSQKIFSASVRLYNTSGYNVVQNTDIKGQTYFIPLELGNYSLEIQAPGYLNLSSAVQISGDNTKTINLNIED